MDAIVISVGALLSTAGAWVDYGVYSAGITHDQLAFGVAAAFAWFLVTHTAGAVLKGI